MKFIRTVAVVPPSENADMPTRATKFYPVGGEGSVPWNFVLFLDHPTGRGFAFNLIHPRRYTSKEYLAASKKVTLSNKDMLLNDQGQAVSYKPGVMFLLEQNIERLTHMTEEISDPEAVMAMWDYLNANAINPERQEPTSDALDAGTWFEPSELLEPEVKSKPSRTKKTQE